MRSDRERLLDIADAITQIERYANQGQAAFQQQELIQVWIVHHLQIIGEAARSLTPAFTAQNDQVPWAQMVAFRNILTHEYFRVDLDLVWRIVVTNVPDLQAQIHNLLQQGDIS
jgi:uncharacterized protein with HEPN domain